LIVNKGVFGSEHKAIEIVEFTKKSKAFVLDKLGYQKENI